jgi:NADH-quinone oxidoreductase subunit J
MLSINTVGVGYMESLVFSILALFLIIGSVAMILFRESIYSAISFLLIMIAMAGMFALLHQSFLFLAQILVGVGAVVVLTLMIIVSINLKEENFPNEKITKQKLIFPALILAPTLLLIWRSISKMDLSFAPIESEFGSIKVVGLELFQNWVLPFEVISILLLSAMVGAIVISKRRLKDAS